MDLGILMLAIRLRIHPETPWRGVGQLSTVNSEKCDSAVASELGQPLGQRLIGVLGYMLVEHRRRREE